MSEVLRFEVLGPQRAWYGERELDLGPGKQRAVLAVLLIAGGRPVPVAQIVDAVWPEDPPGNGPNVVQKYVAGLRRVLEPDRSPRTPGQVLTLTNAGYLLRFAPQALDATRFGLEVREAQRHWAQGRPADALTGLRAALELWRGEPFAGFPGQLFESARQRLLETRAAALETWAELELQLGRHREVIGDLVKLVAEFPVRERLRQQLMLALCRSGRQAEALAAYREIAGLLRDEHGIEPGEELRELHRRILHADPTLAPLPPPDGPPAVPPTASPAAVPPTASPAAVPPTASPAAFVDPSTVPPPPSALPSVPLSPQPSGGYPSPPGWPATPSAGRGGPEPLRWVSNLGTGLGIAAVLLSFGTLTWLVMLFYTIRRRSGWLAGAALLYLALVSFFIMMVSLSDPEAEPSPLDFFGLVAFGTTWIGGAGHVLVLNRSLGRALGGLPPYPAARVVDEQRIRREQARYLLHHHPAARHQLAIGRPDLSRSFDDGGLIDVNAVSDHVLAALPGLNDEQRRQVVTDRWLRGPFGSVEELAGRCLLPPTVTDTLRETLLFLPPARQTDADAAPPTGPPLSPGEGVRRSW